MHAPDHRAVGTPLCADCYDYAGQVLWNAHAGELWRRTRIALDRALAPAASRVLGRRVTIREVRGLLRVSYVKVAEFQKRGVVHLHVVVRLDGVYPDDPKAIVPPPVWASAGLLAGAVSSAAGSAVVALPSPDGRLRVAAWGAQRDVADVLADGPGGDARRVAAYLAKYATKTASDSIGSSHALARCFHRLHRNLLRTQAGPHLARLVETAWALGGRRELAGLRLRAWAHTLGFRGHFATKSRAYSLTLGPSAAATVRRRRGILLAVLDHAVERGILAANPLAGVRLRRARTSDAVNPRTVPDQAQARRLVTSVTESNNPTDRFLSAFFALAYLAGTRPGETRAVVKGDITWPEDITAADAVPGWGLLTAAGSRTEVSASYTDSGTRGETRELKHRAAGDVRMIPLPPEAVKVLRWHIATYGTAPDGRLLWHPTKDNPYDTLPGKVYRRTWARARTAVLTDAEMAAGLAARPYDLRHGYASPAFNPGLPPTMIAKRLGHSVDMLLTVYTHWSDNNDAEANRLLGASLEKGGPITGQLLENTPEKPQNPRSES